ncbi:MAG TPA: carboxypeptidase regulatory-like domain-containing protein [Gammaproteobacteria bacterium]|nr:carboxypeptidase regulatory-like domain-containing protein [Gammaproteobacteria bacterium]
MGLGRNVRGASLLGILALVWGIAAQATPPGTATGVSWLQSQLQTDGSFTNANGIATNTQAESEALKALTATNDPQANLTAGLIDADTTGDTETLSRQIPASVGTSQSASTRVTTLLANQNLDGSFSDFPGYQSTYFDTAYALVALNAAGQGSSDAAHNAALYLANNQGSDGSWTDWQGNDTAYSTALVVEALAPYRLQLASMALAIKNGTAYLSSVRQAGGDWGESFINAQVTLALALGNADTTLVTSAAGDLANAQLADGSWGDDVFTTALALRAAVAVHATAPPTQSISSATGYVVEAGTGRPLAGASVFLASNPQVTTTTNASGYFTLSDLPAGQLTFVASATGYGSTSVVATILTGASNPVGQIVLAQGSATAMVYGKVTSQQNGTPLAGATVQLTGGSSPYSATTAADGSFAFPAVTPGPYTLQIGDTGFISVSSAVTLSGGEQLQSDQALLLTGTYQNSAPVTVSATVVDAATGAAIPGAQVSLGSALTGSAGADGSVSIASVPLGAYQATVSASGYTTASYSFVLAPGSNGALGTLSLYPATAIAAPGTLTLIATVVDGLSHKPVAGATVTDTDTGATATTDANGVATFTGLTALSINVQAAAAGYATQAFTVTASGFGTVAQTLTLPAVGGTSGATSVTLAGTVTDASSGSPISGATVALSDATAQFVTGSTGSYQLPNIPELSFSLQVTAKGYVTQTVPVTVSQFGSYTLAIQLTPAQPASTLQVLTVDAKSATLAATDTGVFTATVGNIGTADVQATLFAEITDGQGAVEADVEGRVPGNTTQSGTFDVPASGQIQAEFDWAPTQLPTGNYTVTVYAAVPNTATRTTPHGTVLAQGNTSVAVDPTEAFTGQLSFSPPLTQAGGQTPVAISALVINGGNQTLATLPLQLTVTDPATGNVVYTATGQATALAVNNNVTVSFGSWLPTTTGNLKVQVVSTDASIAGTVSGTLYVGNKATAQITVDKTIMAPGSNTVHAKVAVQGVDISQAISVDPMFFAVQQAVTKGGAYVAPNAEAWQQRNHCDGCHIQSESLVGLASAAGKATIDPNAIKFLVNTFGTSQQSDGTYRESFPQWATSQNTLGLWALNKWDDHGEFFRSKLAAANVLHNWRVVNSNMVYWNIDFGGTWWSSYDEIAALAISDFAGILKEAATQDISKVKQYVLGAGLAPNGSVYQGWNVVRGPDGLLYANQQNGVIDWVNPSTGAHGTVSMPGLPAEADSLAVAPDGSIYVSGFIGSNGYIAHGVPGQSATIIWEGPGEISSVALSPAGVLYALNRPMNQLLRFDGSTPTVVLDSTVLNHPNNMDFDPAGDLMIADWQNDDLVELRADGTESVFAAGLQQGPVSISYDGSGGWYVAAFWSNTYDAGNSFYNDLGLYHFNADGTGERLADTPNCDGLTMWNGMPVMVDRTHNTLTPVTASPINPVILSNMQTDLAGAVQFLFRRGEDTDRIVEAMRLWGFAESRSAITDPTLLSSINTEIATIDARLRGYQNKDGGWGRNTGQVSDALVTALVGLALDYSHPSTSDPATRNAIQFLLNSQQGDGSWLSADGIMTTRLATTALVMDYMPDALQFLGGIDVDLYVQDVPGKVSLGNFVPQPGDTVIGGDGSSIYDWHMTGVTSEEDVTFDVNLPNMLANEIRPVAGSAYLTFKNSFTGELLTTPLDIPQVQAVSGLGLTVGTDRPQYPGVTPVLISGDAGNNGVPTMNAQVLLTITAPDGTVVATLPAIAGLQIPTGGELPYTAQWNTGDYLPGTYTVTASIVDDTGTVANKAATSFIIANSSAGGTGSAEATLRTSTDRTTYNTTDTVNIVDLVASVTDNSILSLVHLHVVVTGPSGNTVGTYDHDLGQLAPGALDNLPDVLTLNHAVQGLYTVSGTLTDNTGATLATGSAMFTVAENLGKTLTGQVTLQAPKVYAGTPEVCTDTVTNTGTLAMSSQPLQALLVNLASGTTLSTTPSTASLAPGQQRQTQQTVDTTPLAVGDYTCLLQAQVNGAWTTLGYATFHVADPTADLAGTLTATPTQVPLTTNVALAGSLSNGGFASIPGITATISIQDPSGNTVFSSPVSIASLGMGQASQLLANWTAAGNVGDVDTAILTATVGSHSRVLAQAQFTLLPPPIKIGAGMAEGAHGRVLILTDDPAAYPGNQDPFGPSPAPGLAAQNQHLGQVLTAAGWSYTIVTNATDFQTQFNTGGYEAYVILSEAVKLPESLQEQVDAAVNSGAGLIVAGNHDDRNNKLEDALGIHSTGKSLSVTGLELDANSLDQAGGQVSLPIDGQPLTVNKDSATAVGNFELTGGGTAPAVFTYGYGTGKSVYVAFDLALEEAAANSPNSLFDQLMLDSLNYVSPTNLTPYTGRVIPLVLTIQNQGNPTPGEAMVTLPTGVTVIDPNGATVSGNTLSWVFNLAVGQTLTETFWVQLPATAGSLTVPALVESGTAPNLTPQASTSMIIAVQARP